MSRNLLPPPPPPPAEILDDDPPDAPPASPVTVTAENRASLRHEALNLVTQARGLQDRADAERRDLTSDENQQWERMIERATQIDESVDRFEKRQRLELLNDRLNQPGERRTRPTGGETGETAHEARLRRVAEQRNRMFETYLRHGDKAILTAEQQQLYAEQRDLAVGLGTSGGYLAAPDQFAGEVIKNVDNMTFLWNLANKFSLDMGQSLGAPTLENDPSDADWTVEASVGLGSPDSTMSFGKRKLTPHPLAKAIKVSNDLLMVRNYNAGAFVAERLAYKVAVTLEKGMMTGHGAGQPLGVFTASSDGINTDRDVSGDNTTTALKTDSLLDAIGSLKQQYLNDPSTAWVFSRTALTQLHKLKDGTGNYLVQPNLVERRGLTIRGYPILLSEYCPATFTTGLYVGMLAAWRHVWGAFVGSMAVQRLVELYAATNQTAFILRGHWDAQPVVPEAFARIKLSA